LMGAFGGRNCQSDLPPVLFAGLLARPRLAAQPLGTIVAVATARFRADQMVYRFGRQYFLLSGPYEFFCCAACSAAMRRRSFLPTPGGRSPIPFFGSRLPIIGPVLFAQPALTYAAFRPSLSHFNLFLMKTRLWACASRGSAENPAAAFSTGTDPGSRQNGVLPLPVLRLPGSEGAVLSLQELGTFTDGMTNGRGFYRAGCNHRRPLDTTAGYARLPLPVLGPRFRARLEYPRLGSAHQLLHLCRMMPYLIALGRTLRDWPQGEECRPAIGETF